jgi:hypothetical protein
MPDPARKPDAIDQADALLRRPSPTLDELMAGVPVITSWDQLDIPDLTDEERRAFAAALDGDE